MGDPKPTLNQLRVASNDTDNRKVFSETFWADLTPQSDQ
jgi:hypothetical protein